MTDFAAESLRSLGLKLPKEYSDFIDRYREKLPDDPIRAESWIKGLGSPDFVIGTTAAFRTTIPKFRPQGVIIGYAGNKTVTVNRVDEQIDEYVMIDCQDGSVHSVDSLGVSRRLAADFDQWIGQELWRATLRDKYASHLTVVVFDDPLQAETARLKLRQLQREGFVDLEDAVVVVKDPDGRVTTQQLHHLAGKGGLAGSITGLLVGSILLSPWLGVVFGAVSGAISASLTDVGIDDRFMHDLAKTFQPGSSALFTLVRRAEPEQAAKELFGMGGKVLVSSVGPEREAFLQALLDGSRRDVE